MYVCMYILIFFSMCMYTLFDGIALSAIFIILSLYHSLFFPTPFCFTCHNFCFRVASAQLLLRYAWQRKIPRASITNRLETRKVRLHFGSSAYTFPLPSFSMLLPVPWSIYPLRLYVFSRFHRKRFRSL
jgi:hypothetical protein